MFSFKSLTHLPLKKIVYRYIPKRSPFDQTTYIDEFIPRPNSYPPSRKPRLAQWTDEKVIWPVLLPKPTKLVGNSLIQEVEKSQKINIERARPFIVPEFSSGDVIRFTFYHSLSEKKSNTYTGICLSRKLKNSLMASFRVLFRFCGVQVEMNVKQNSPFLADLKVIERGSGKLRAKLNYLPQQELTKEELMKPIGKSGKKRRVPKEVSTSKKIRAEKVDDPMWQ